MLYGIAMGKESNQMVEKDAYLQLTDKDYSYTVDEILGKEEGLYRMEQAGTRKTDTANLNRIWSVEQYSSSIYSSTYNEAYQNFRKDIFQVEQPYRNIFMQARAQNPICYCERWKFLCRLEGKTSIQDSGNKSWIGAKRNKKQTFQRKELVHSKSK